MKFRVIGTLNNFVMHEIHFHSFKRLVFFIIGYIHPVEDNLTKKQKAFDTFLISCDNLQRSWVGTMNKYNIYSIIRDSCERSTAPPA